MYVQRSTVAPLRNNCCNRNTKMHNISMVVHFKSSYQQYGVTEKYIVKPTVRESTPKYK
jgi:hypothetical protein